MIASCDYEQRYDPAAWRRILDDPRIDGAVWTWRADGHFLKNPEAFAYCRTGEDGATIIEISEKRTISDRPGRDPLAIGTFWYRRAGDFLHGARKMIARGKTVNGEHYVGTSINELIEEGARFVIFEVEQWISFGDPFELKVLEFWESYFCRYPLHGAFAACRGMGGRASKAASEISLVWARVPIWPGLSRGLLIFKLLFTKNKGRRF